MRIIRAAFPAVLGVIAALGAVPAVADSVAVTSGPSGTAIVNGKPCRVVTTHDGTSGTTSSNSTTITTGPNGQLSGSTSVSPGNAGTSVTVGSGSSSNGTQASSAAGSDCVIYRHEK